jgi:hypothetical protein
MAEEPTFWMVYDPQGETPTRQHTSENNAIHEAERLAAMFPGHNFYVLEPISVTTFPRAITTRLEKVPF